MGRRRKKIYVTLHTHVERMKKSERERERERTKLKMKDSNGTRGIFSFSNLYLLAKWFWSVYVSVLICMYLSTASIQYMLVGTPFPKYMRRLNCITYISYMCI